MSDIRTPKNIIRHELIGLQCEVIGTSNKSQLGIKGKVVDETMKTVVISGRRVPKQGTTFRVELDGKKVRIDGNCLVSRPEDRIKKKISKW